MNMAKLFQDAKLNAQEKDLMKEIVTSMMAPPSNQADLAKRGAKIKKTILQISKKSRIAEPVRLMGVQFLVMFHTMEAMKLGQAMSKSGSNVENSLQDPKVVEFRESQQKDMLTCWKLLTFKSDIAEAVQAAQLLKVDVAQRLESSVKLSEVFEEMSKNIPKMPMQQAMVAFTAAPMLGQWVKFELIAARILALTGSLEQFHVMSQQMPVPDFEVLYRMAKQAKMKDMPPTPADKCLWETYEVTKIRVKFKDVRCEGFEEKEQEIRKEITKNDSDKWEDVPNTEQIQIKRMGGIVQTMSFGEVPMQVVGPWYDDRMHVKGYTEIMMTGQDMSEADQQALQMQIMSGQLSPDQLPMIRQSEMWDLQRDETDKTLYKGVYTLDQTPMLSAEDKKKANSDNAPIKMTFHCEMSIREVDGSLHSRGPDAADAGRIEDEKTEDTGGDKIVTGIDGLTLD